MDRGAWRATVLAIRLRDREAVRAFYEKRERETAEAEARAAAEAAEKAAAERAANPTAEDYLREIRDLLKKAP